MKILKISTEIEPATYRIVARILLLYSVMEKVKFSRYRPGVAQRVGRGIVLLFHDRDTKRGVSGQQHAPAELYPQERPGTHCTGGWVGPRARLERAENFVLTGIRSRTFQPVVSHYAD